MIEIKGQTPAELDVTNEAVTSKESLRFYNIKQEPFRIYGLYEPLTSERYHRLNDDVAAATNSGVKGLNNNTAGGRVRFVTTSNYLAAKVVTNGSAKMINMCYIGSSSFDVYVKRTGRETFAGVLRPAAFYEKGYDAVISLPGSGEREVTVNFPLYSGCVELYLGLDSNATLSRHPDYTYEKPVLYYGSSITQGGCASRPGMSYQAIISRRLDANYMNLGFSGSARGEDPMVKYLSEQDCSVFVLDYDHNAPSVEHLYKTHENLYLNFRKAHPDTPVVMVGKPDFWMYDRTAMDRRDVIYRTCERARARGEKVIFVDGQSLFAGEMREDCTVDGCHPNDLGMTRMADVIGKAVDFALSM